MFGEPLPPLSLQMVSTSWSKSRGYLVSVFAFVFSYIVFSILKATIGVRVSEKRKSVDSTYPNMVRKHMVLITNLKLHTKFII